MSTKSRVFVRRHYWYPLQDDQDRQVTNIQASRTMLCMHPYAQQDYADDDHDDDRDDGDNAFATRHPLARHGKITRMPTRPTWRKDTLVHSALARLGRILPREQWLRSGDEIASILKETDFENVWSIGFERLDLVRNKKNSFRRNGCRLCLIALFLRLRPSKLSSPSAAIPMGMIWAMTSANNPTCEFVGIFSSPLYMAFRMAVGTTANAPALSTEILPEVAAVAAEWGCVQLSVGPQQRMEDILRHKHNFRTLAAGRRRRMRFVDAPCGVMSGRLWKPISRSTMIQARTSRFARFLFMLESHLAREKRAHVHHGSALDVAVTLAERHLEMLRQVANETWYVKWPPRIALEWDSLVCDFDERDPDRQQRERLAWRVWRFYRKIYKRPGDVFYKALRNHRQMCTILVAPLCTTH